MEPNLLLLCCVCVTAERSGWFCSLAFVLARPRAALVLLWPPLVLPAFLAFPPLRDCPSHPSLPWTIWSPDPDSFRVFFPCFLPCGLGCSAVVFFLFRLCCCFLPMFRVQVLTSPPSRPCPTPDSGLGSARCCSSPLFAVRCALVAPRTPLPVRTSHCFLSAGLSAFCYAFC